MGMDAMKLFRPTTISHCNDYMSLVSHRQILITCNIHDEARRILQLRCHRHRSRSAYIRLSTRAEKWFNVAFDIGLYGIQAARYYLELYPTANLCILESDDVVGGVWSSSE